MPSTATPARTGTSIDSGRPNKAGGLLDSRFVAEQCMAGSPSTLCFCENERMREAFYPERSSYRNDRRVSIAPAELTSPRHCGAGVPAATEDLLPPGSRLRTAGGFLFEKHPLQI